MIEITSSIGRLLDLKWRYEGEPNHASVVMTEGPTGTAWQRMHKDGMWHRAGGGRPRDWAWLILQRNVVLVYEAPPRVDVEQAALRTEKSPMGVGPGIVINVNPTMEEDIRRTLNTKRRREWG